MNKGRGRGKIERDKEDAVTPTQKEGRIDM